MPKAAARDPIYRGRRFSAETIELCVRWYLTYRLSYRDLSAMLAERGIEVSHTTILRWVLHFVPEYERRWARFARPVNPSWRMDETAASVRGGHYYLYRAVDRNGKSVHSLLCRDRSFESAQAFFREAVAAGGEPWPSKINLDGNAATHRALRLLGDENARWRSVEIRACRYLNNVVEQDHRAVKRRCASMLGLKSFKTAAITLSGVELAHRIRKQQFTLPAEREAMTSSLKELWTRALGCGHEFAGGCGDRFPLSHQISTSRNVANNSRVPRPGGRRSGWKISFGRSLFLLVTPKGGRYWRYRYRYGGKQKTLALGAFPDVPTESAKTRHQAARQLLAAGVDPSARRKELRGLAA